MVKQQFQSRSLITVKYMHLTQLIRGEGAMKIGRKCLEIFFLAKIIPQTHFHSRSLSSSRARGIEKAMDARYGIVIFSLSLSPFFFPPPSSPPRGSRRVCRRVLTDTGHVLATSSGLSLFPRRFWNTLSSQTTAAAVLNKLLLARVRHASTKSSTLLPATRHSNFPNFFPPI